MSRIKGAAVRARLEFVREQHGEEALQRILESLEDMNRVILSGTGLPSIWYPIQVLSDFDEAASRILGEENGSLFEAAGEHVARQHAKSIYRVFFRETEPSRVLRLASCIFSNYFSGLGRLSLKSDQGGQVQRLVVTGAAGTARSNCLTSLAYFRTVLAACTDLPVDARETRCRCWGDEACEFEFETQQVLERAVS
jgi:predicted hydrocarbon binding protein